MADTAKLSILRSQRTKMRNRITAASTLAFQHEALSADNKAGVVELLTLVETRAASLQTLDERILNHPDLDENVIETEVTEIDEFSEVTIQCIAHLKRLLSEGVVGAAGEINNEAEVAGGRRNSRDSDNSSNNPIVVAAAAPVLDVTPDIFDGDRLRYRSWRAQFNNWIGRRTTASDTDRLVALQKLIRGAPRALVDQIAINDENYKVALKLLDDNYGMVSVTRQQVLDRLVNIPSVHTAQDLVGLRKLLNHVQGSIMAMEGLGVPLTQYALTYERTIMAAVPSTLLFDYTENQRVTTLALRAAGGDGAVDGAADDDLSSDKAAQRIKGLLEFVRRYTDHREQMSLSGPQGRPGGDARRQFNVAGGRSTSFGSGRPPQSREYNRATVAATATSTSASESASAGGRGAAGVTAAAAVPRQQRKFKACLFCKDESHSSSRCRASLTHQQRCQLLDKMNRCHTCFRDRHEQGSRCSGPHVPCRICNDKGHYTSMHLPRTGAAGASQVAFPVVAHPVAFATTPQSLVLVASAYLIYGSSRIPIRIFLDPGSSLTFMLPRQLLSMPALRPQQQADIDIQAFAKAHHITTQRFQIQLVSTYDKTLKMDLYAYTHDFGVDPSSDCPPHVKEAIDNFGKTHPLADRSLTGDTPAHAPALLVGIDQYYKIAYLGQEKLVVEGLVAKNTRLGWVVGGPVSRPSTQASVSRVHPFCCAATLSSSTRDVEKLWTLEAVGIKDKDTSDLSADEEDALRQFHKGVSYDGKTYTVSMPKRPSIVGLSNNKGVAMNRLISKRRSLMRDPAVYDRYNKEIMTFVEEGHAEEVMGVDLSLTDEFDGSYYMPHHQVITKSEDREKWRIVFDCSASAPRATSLNTHLIPGPNLNPDLVKLLLNFRLHRVAVSADIARAYMMINLEEADRPLFRFLWWGPEDPLPRCYQMKKVTWGAAPSGFLLAATLREILKRVDPNNKLDVGGSLYHDDLLCSFSSHDDAIKFVEKVVKWLAAAGMSLAKWKTNSSEVVRYLTRSGVASADTAIVEGSFLKVLGVAWSPADDQFRFQLSVLTNTVRDLPKVTKRAVLRIVASIFDPAGWLLPFTLRGKVLIQLLWSESLTWDEEIPEALLELFRGWTEEFSDLSEIRIQRTSSQANKEAVKYHLHLLGDASETAYSATAYLQTHYDDDTSSCMLLMAKSRLAPLEKITLPRLELLAALLTTRLRTFLIERLQIKIDQVFHYTDSTVTYHWCTHEQPTRWKQFVANRVAEIRLSSSPSEWYHVPGEHNVADLATRGVSAKELATNRQWWTGPNWLQVPPQDRPITQPKTGGSPESATVNNELRAVVAPVVLAAPLFDLNRCSSWDSAARIVANVLRFVHRCRKEIVPTEAELRRVAELKLIGWTQAETCSAEIAATKDGERPPRSSRFASNVLFFDNDGLLRAQTRLTKGPNFTDEEKTPIIIPGESRLAILLIMHYHRINAHFGTNTILSALRRKYWITRARQITRTLLRRCVTCRKSHGPSADQVRAPLPAERVTLIAPFSTAGLDFCGPFYVRSREGTAKCYIALFTCASIRAVWLELVPSMSTVQTHLAIRRFLSMFPSCKQIISDNGRSFVKAASDLKKVFNSANAPEVREFLAARQVTWSFNCPKAPWHGGFFERLVGTVKRSLSKTLGRSLITFDEMRTTLCELAAVINDRPLSYVDADPNEPHPITPADFMRGGPVQSPLAVIGALDALGSSGTAPPMEAPTPDDLRAGVRDRTSYFKALAGRWHREYLLQLNSANCGNRARSRPIRQGDICILKDDNRSRTKWELVRVLEGHPGRDGFVRTYSIRFSNGYESRRAAQLLYPLEVV